MLFPYGRCPNSLRPPPLPTHPPTHPPSFKWVTWSTLCGPYFFICFFDIAKMALDPRPPLSNRQTWGKKVFQTILASLSIPPPLWKMPIWKQHISKRDFLKTEQSQCQRGSSKRVRARCKAKQRRMWLVGSDKINSSLFNFKAEATKSEEGKAMYLVR